MPDPCPSPHQKAAGFARSPHMDSFTKEHVFAILVSAPVAMLVWQKARKSENFQEKLSQVIWINPNILMTFIFISCSFHLLSGNTLLISNHTDILRPNRLLPADAPSIHNKELYHAAAPMTAQCPGCLSSAPISVNASNATGIQRLQQKPEGLQQQAPKWITNIPRKTPMGWTIKTVGFLCVPNPTGRFGITTATKWLVQVPVALDHIQILNGILQIKAKRIQRLNLQPIPKHTSPWQSSTLRILYLQVQNAANCSKGKIKKMALKHARPPMEASPQLKLTRSVAIVYCESWRKWHSACPVCGLLDPTNHYMSSIYFGAQEHALVMLVTLKLCSSCFRSQMYFGGTGCKSSYFRRVHGTPGANKCSFANPRGISRLGSQCSSTCSARIKALKNKTHDGFICVWKHTSVISPNMCQLHWSLLLSRPQTAIALSRGKAVYIWWKTSIPNVVWLFAGSMSHGHQGIIIDCLAQATAICPHCKTLNLALNKNWHLRLNLLSMYGFPTLFPTIVSWLRSCNRVKNLLAKIQFQMVFQTVTGVTRDHKITYLEESKQCKCMVNFEGFPLNGALFPLPAVHLER